MKTTTIPNFATKKELYDFLIKHKDVLMAEKRLAIKFGEEVPFMDTFYDDKDKAFKANNPVPGAEGMEELRVKVVINTTNIMDRHGDMHVPGLWKKSLKENKMIMHLQEHKMAFDSIIADGKDLKAYTETMGWLDLGYAFTGLTEALIFESFIRKSRNEYMFKQYASGYVKNHSVGMQYVTMVLCIMEDSPAYGAEYEAWQKYFPMMVNQAAAEERGYFWAIKEAKVIEGSAVPLGSNYATPTLDNNMPKGAPSNHAPEEPAKATPINFDYLKTNLKIH